MAHQDWEVRGVGGNGPRPSYNNNINVVSDPPKSEKKKKVRVDDEQEDFTQAKIPRKFSVALQKARLKKGWKQAELAQALNVKVTVINQYESGKAIPDGGLINKINRILNTRLPTVQKRGGGGNEIGAVKKKRKRPVKRNRKKKTNTNGGGL